MTYRVLAAWTSSALLDYPEYVTIYQVAEKITLKIRGTDGSKEVTQVTMDRDEFLRLASQALAGAIS